MLFYNHKPANSQILDRDFVMNGKKYCLIGDLGLPSSESLAEIGVHACKSDDKTTWTAGVPFAKGVLEIKILSVGNGGAATVPISLSNSEYATIKQILGTLKF